MAILHWFLKVLSFYFGKISNKGGKKKVLGIVNIKIEVLRWKYSIAI